MLILLCLSFRGEIRLADSLGFLALYLVYIMVVAIGRMINQRMRKRRAAEADRARILDDASVDDEVDEVDGDEANLFVPRHLLNGKSHSESAEGTVEVATVEQNYRSWVDPATMVYLFMHEFAARGLLLFFVFSACGGLHTGSKLPLLTAYFPVLA